jgi:sugar phosphate isomerase/epimerase
VPNRSNPAVPPSPPSAPACAAVARAAVGRRRFLGSLAAVTGSAWAAPAGPSVAAETEAPRSTTPFHPKLAIAADTFRKQFAWFKGKPQQPSGRPIDMHGFLEHCAALDVAAELTAYFFPADLDREALLALRREAFLRGVTICGTAIGNHFDTATGTALEAEIRDAKRWLDHAATMGAPHIRFFAGTAAGLAAPGRFAQSVAATRECAEYAADRGVMIGIENHGGITPATLLRFLDEVDHPWVGINLDTGNFYSDDPYADLAACVDRAIHVQWKASVRDSKRKKSPADYRRIADILREAHYAGFIALEYEEGDDPYAATAEHLARIREAIG